MNLIISKPVVMASEPMKLKVAKDKKAFIYV